MPYKDLREFLSRLEDEGELLIVKSEVNWDLEIGAILRRATDLGEDWPAVQFDQIKDYGVGHSLVANTLSNFRRYALALDLPKETLPLEMVHEYKERLRHQISPKLVNDGPCKENIITGEQVDLYKFPTPKWNTLDGGKYFGTSCCAITKDPETGWVNVAVYRNIIHDKQHLGIFIGKTKHAMMMFQKHKQENKSMPIAITVGQDPINLIAGYHNAEAEESEWEIAGGLRKAPVELVKCETIDLEVPATAEIVIEGEWLPNELREEGPYGEYSGYYGGERAPRPVIRVNAITPRNNAIHTGSILGKPITETHVMSAIGHSAKLEQVLKDQLKLEIKSVYSHPWTIGHAVFVSARRDILGLGKRIAHAIWSSSIGYRKDYVIIVGEDIDVTNLGEVFWAITSRCKPDRDIMIFPNEPASHLLTSLTPEDRRLGKGAHVVMEAAFPADWPKEWVPRVCDWEHIPDEIKALVKRRWREYGFKEPPPGQSN